ncbi:MAG: penicillin-binding transpeptidase domain-containing protein, partial [Oscillospiraceae bacterium]|nr:penicillin-binding transpeptidase domain-containing protein [Oscillospiraceae bacterium]
EIFRALEFEKKYTKQEIMEWYLNYIYFGEGSNGINSAAETYFAKPVSELSIAECASLIGITNNPSKYDPYINPSGNKERQELILKEMYGQNYITKQQYDEAVSEQLVLKRSGSQQEKQSVYSYYVDQVVSDVISDLVNEWDISYNAATELLYTGGYKIYCNINPKVQQAVDNVYENERNLPYKSSDGQPLQSAITIEDPYTGHIVAISGGMGEKNTSRGWSRATNTIRPPGSSIKPLSVYAPALELGLITPATVFDDTPYSLEKGTAWPVNADNVYSGLTTVYNALRVSKNTVAVKVLSKVTPQYAFNFLKNKLGITSLVDQREINGSVYSDINLAPLALGGLTDGVSTREMAAAYAAFVNKGVYTESTTYSKVLDSGGNIVLEKRPKTNTAMSEGAAFYINEMLKGVVSSGTGTNANFSGMTIAGKTGTTSSKKDTWFVGYTPYYVAAVWVGYDQQKKINVSTNQAPILWEKVMSQVHKGLQNRDFDQPDNVVKINYCLDSGKLATSLCQRDTRGSRVTSGYFLAKDAPAQYCDIHKSVEVCVHKELDASGNITTKYYLARPYCPEFSKMVISLPSYTRTLVKSGIYVQDYPYSMAALLDRGQCPYHNASYGSNGSGGPTSETPAESSSAGQSLPVQIPANGKDFSSWSSNGQWNPAA